ncbi:MAG: hypothetical protein M3380_09520 [Chloroflexota bacterium]|nr:hypothetical protein [Chloroflexota bacterium]
MDELVMLGDRMLLQLDLITVLAVAWHRRTVEQLQRASKSIGYGSTGCMASDRLAREGTMLWLSRLMSGTGTFVGTLGRDGLVTGVLA